MNKDDEIDFQPVFRGFGLIGVAILSIYLFYDQINVILFNVIYLFYTIINNVYFIAFFVFSVAFSFAETYYRPALNKSKLKPFSCFKDDGWIIPVFIIVFGVFLSCLGMLSLFILISVENGLENILNANHPLLYSFYQANTIQDTLYSVLNGRIKLGFDFVVMGLLGILLSVYSIFIINMSLKNIRSKIRYGHSKDLLDK